MVRNSWRSLAQLSLSSGVWGSRPYGGSSKRFTELSLTPRTQLLTPTQDDANDDRVDGIGDADGEQTKENRGKWPLARRFSQAVYISDVLTGTLAKLA